ncbi:unnamed protein product [Amaranthus hypochondriacus]
MEAKNSNKNKQIAIVMVPFPLQGHLNQLLQLSHLISSYGLPVHYVGSSTHNRQAKLRLAIRGSGSPTNIHFHNLELPPYESPAPNPDPSNHFPTHFHPLFNACLNLRQPVYKVVQQLSSNHSRVVVIHDNLMAYVVQDCKLISSVETYVFFSISAFCMIAWETAQQNKSGLLPESNPSMEDGCFSEEALEFILKQEQFWGSESGRLYNTSKVIENKYVELLGKIHTNPKIKHFALGPFNPIPTKTPQNKHQCLNWLDKHEPNSVIYISFGSTTSLTDEQTTELAIALEKSGLNFLWVLRKADSADIFSNGESKLPDLPEGYEDLIRNRGMIVQEWVPQVEILGHESVGGFMTHCGWNSCMESISMGVPMAAWPMHSDQPSNACFVTDVLKIGTMVRDWSRRREVVASTVIEMALRRLMESEEGMVMRKRAQELGVNVRASLQDGGLFHVEMGLFISHITTT